MREVRRMPLDELLWWFDEAGRMLDEDRAARQAAEQR
jgi:hypothetical protein